jgi:hypothetical protein
LKGKSLMENTDLTTYAQTIGEVLMVRQVSRSGLTCFREYQTAQSIQVTAVTLTLRIQPQIWIKCVSC